MTTVIVWFIIVYLLTLPVRLALRRRARVTPPVVVVVQIPASPPQTPLTIDDEWARIQARDGIR